MHKNVFHDRTDVTVDWDFDRGIVEEVHPRARIQIIAGIAGERHNISPFIFLEHVISFHIEETKVTFRWSSREACQSFMETIDDAMIMLGTDQAVEHLDKDGRALKAT